jgi:hypothetical protein
MIVGLQCNNLEYRILLCFLFSASRSKEVYVESKLFVS